MNAPLDIREILSAQRSVARGRPSNFPAEVMKARRKEQGDRSGHAQARARRALTLLYPNEYRTLYEQAKAWIDEERGPLPGDKA